ncbi:uncharacterized protein LOC135466434 [Liolophura sinensis]|uniref:uncharacterized protein LOC135466434 n=1 Tax=Liolophura sinensis TaxID=3198878 RepID=UPI0031591CB4
MRCSPTRPGEVHPLMGAEVEGEVPPTEIDEIHPPETDEAHPQETDEAHLSDTDLHIEVETPHLEITGDHCQGTSEIDMVLPLPGTGGVPSPRRDRHSSPHRDRRDSSPYRDRRGSLTHRDRRGSSPSRYRQGSSPSRDRRGSSPSRHHRDSSPRDRRPSSPYSDRHSSSDRDSHYRSPPRQEMRFLTGDTDLREKPTDHLENAQHLYNQNEALHSGFNPRLNTDAPVRSDIQSRERPGHSPIFKDLYRESSPSRAELPNLLQPLRRHPLPGFSYVEDDNGSQSPNLSTLTTVQSQDSNAVTRMPLGLPGEQRAIPPPPTAKPKKSILKKSTDNAKQSPVISGFGDCSEALPGFTSAPEIIPHTKPLFPSAFPGQKPPQSQASAMPSVLPQSQYSGVNSMEIDDEEMFLYGKSSSSSQPVQGFDERKDYLLGRDSNAGQKSVLESSSLLQDSLKFLRNEQSKPSSHPENPIVFDAKATAQLHSLASSVLLSQNSSRVNKLPDMLGLGNAPVSSLPSAPLSHGMIGGDPIANSSFIDSSLGRQVPVSSVAGLPSQHHHLAQSYQSGALPPVSQPKEEAVDNNLIQNPMIKGILQSIGFDFEMSKRMQERAKHATGLKVQQIVEPVKAEPLPSVEDSQFGINQTASFLSGGLSDIELRGSLFKKEEEDVESLVKSAQQNVRQAERNYRDRETKAMQFQNQEAIVDNKQSPYPQLQKHQYGTSTQFGAVSIDHYTNTPPDPRQSLLKNMYDPLHDESVMYERDYDMPPQQLQHPDDRESHLIPLVGRDGSRISVDRDSAKYSLGRDSKRLAGRDHFDPYSRSISHDRRTHSDRSVSPRRRSISPRRSTSPRRSVSSDRRSISQDRRSFSPDRKSISCGRSVSPGGRSISPNRRSLSPPHRRGLSQDTRDERSRSPSRHSRHRRSDSYGKRSLSPHSRNESESWKYRDSRRPSDDKSQIKIMRTFPSREKSSERYSIDRRYRRSDSEKEEDVQETRTVVASGPVIRRTVLAPKVEVPTLHASSAAAIVKKQLQTGKSLLTQKEREKLMQERADRQRRLEGLERELERLRKQQNELMRKKQRQKDGHKDPVLVENSKLQEEIAQQISSLRKAADENSKTLKASGGGLKLKKEVSVKDIHKEEEIEETRTVTTESSVEPPPAKPVKENVVYEYIDPGNHWCRTCNHISSNIFEVFHHLQSKKHLQKSDPYDRPWMPEAVKNPSGAPPKKGKEVQVAMIKGVEFLRPTQAFYCTLCSVFSGDELCAEHHLKSEEHNSRYKKYTEDNLFYERGINLDKAAGISMMKEDEKNGERKTDKRKPEANVKEESVEEINKRRKLAFEEDERKRKQKIEEERLKRQSVYEKRDQKIKESLKKSEKPVDDLSGEGGTEEKWATSDSSGKAIKLTLKGEKEPTASPQAGKKGKVFSNFTWTKKENKPLITKGSDVFADDEEEDDDADAANATQIADTKDVPSAEQVKGVKIAIKLTGKTQIKPHVKSAYPTWTTVANKPPPVKQPPKPQIVTVRKSSKSEEETTSAPLDQFLSIGEASSKKPLPVIKEATVDKSEVTTEKHSSTKDKSSMGLDLASIPTPKDPPPPSKSSASEKESLEEMKLLGIDPASSNPLAVPKPPPPASKAKKKKGSKNKKATEKDQGSAPGSKTVQDLFDIFYGQKSEANSEGTPAPPKTVSSDTAAAQPTTATLSAQIDPTIPNHYPSGPPTFLQNPPETFYGPPPFSCGPPAYQGGMPYGSQMNMFPQGPGPCQFAPRPFQQGFPPGRGFYPGPRGPQGPHYYGPRPMGPSPFGPRPMGPGPFGPGPMGSGPMGPRPFGLSGPHNHGPMGPGGMRPDLTDQSAPTSSNSTENNTIVSSASKSTAALVSVTVPSSASDTVATCATAPETVRSTDELTLKTDDLSTDPRGPARARDATSDPSASTDARTRSAHPPSTLPALEQPVTVDSLVTVTNTNPSTTDLSCSCTDQPVSTVEAETISEPIIVSGTPVPTAVADIHIVGDEGNLSESVSIAGSAISITTSIESGETAGEYTYSTPQIVPEENTPVENVSLASEQRSPHNYTEADNGSRVSNPVNTAKLEEDLSVTNHTGSDSSSNMPLSFEPMPREENISNEALASNETVIFQDMSTLASLITPAAEIGSEQLSNQNQDFRTEEPAFFGRTHGAEILRQDSLDSATRFTAPPEFSAPDQMDVASNDFMPHTLSGMISMDASLGSPEPLTFNPEVLADMEYFPGEGMTSANASLTESLLGLSSGVEFVNPNMTLNNCEMQTDDVTSNGSGTSMNIGDFHVLDECEED